MSIRLVLTITAAPGRGAELARVYQARAAEVLKEPGCEQFEFFSGVADPDRLILMERWTDQAALAAHAKLQETRAPVPAELVAGVSQREDYQYNRTR